MSKYIDEFVDFLRERHRVGKSTISSYRRDIELFFERQRLTDESSIKVDTESLQGYLASLAEEGKSDSTVLRSAASLRNFYAFLTESGRVSFNPAEGLELPKKSKKAIVVLTPSEINKLLSLPRGDDPKGLRDKAMLELLYATGIKVSELISLELKDIDLAEGSVLCRTGDHQRTVPMGTAAEMAVSEYINSARDKMVENGRIKTLFVSCQGKPMTRQGFWKLMKTYIAEAGIKKEVTPQTLRHSFAVHLLENGADIRDVSEMLGYNDRSSGRIYKNVVNDRLKKTYRRAHPRA
ncbi:MAG: tyrosine recombinase [Oscillospiraceae bacterium]|nr:tyrosine recombinase [Oscillospiraceae bacterium]